MSKSRILKTLIWRFFLGCSACMLSMMPQSAEEEWSILHSEERKCTDDTSLTWEGGVTSPVAAGTIPERLWPSCREQLRSRLPPGGSTGAPRRTCLSAGLSKAVAGREDFCWSSIGSRFEANQQGLRCQQALLEPPSASDAVGVDQHGRMRRTASKRAWSPIFPEL